ncbi:pro-sigmaK processing inhibitor BofA family protein [Brevibacillus ruminantium]|uniref:Pro-sigmaK processing inhibitor BofA family protein n=1 Tax=Brevibacillus ruminantium TaxID=2950604 RepID=A0ABY4WJ44_9BACL|nr:pro-sigmaK processing inhibitor BofA family protein [Brevibacillus ruminantium]USG65875.1 pro-sigmaK processing inhibitor BofA family protein [Brevibacillus ruminantium]
MTSGWIIALLVAGLLVVIAASKSAWKPIRWIGLGAMQLVIGAVLLFFANLIGDLADFHIPINPVTALVTGLLRLPGLAALIIIKMWLL